MKLVTIFFLFISMLTCRLQAEERQFMPVADVNFVADFHSSEDKNRYGVLVLGGSEGGKPMRLANKIATLGYSVLALAYFKDEGLPKELEMIPLEYFDAPKQWLLDNMGTRNDGLVVVGWSKGAELALLLSSREEQYQGVVGIAPSSVVWAGILKDWSKVPSSSWSEDAKPLPFVPFATGVAFKGLADLYEQSLKNSEAVNLASIKAESIRKPALLLSGGEDEIWPSKAMADITCERINASQDTDLCIHIHYPKAGHLLDENYVDSQDMPVNAVANKSSTDRIRLFLRDLNLQ